MVSDLSWYFFVFPLFLAEGCWKLLHFKLVLVKFLLVVSDLELLLFNQTVLLWQFNVDILFKLINWVKFGRVSFSVAFPPLYFQFQSLIVRLQSGNEFFLFLILLEQLEVLLMHPVQFMFVLDLPGFKFMYFLLLPIKLHPQFVYLVGPGCNFPPVLLL